MIVLHIEHPVASFEGWKKTFDADPIDRKLSGVKSYKVYRSISDENFVAVDLASDSQGEAEQALQKLQSVWNKVQGAVITAPKGLLFEVVESADL